MEHEGMNRRLVIGALSLLAVIALVGVAISRTHDAKVTVRSDGSRAAAAPTAAAPVSPPSVRSAGACTSGIATAAVPANPKEAEIMAGFAPAKGASGDAKPTSSAVVAQAVSADPATTEAAAKASATSSAVVSELAYKDLVARTRGEIAAHPFMNPDRCVYVVTIHAPFTGDAPAGSKPVTYPVYNVVLDEATGTELTLQAGLDLSKI